MTLAAAVFCRRTVHISGGWKTNGVAPVMMAKPLWNLWKVFRISYGFSILTHDIICRIV